MTRYYRMSPVSIFALVPAGWAHSRGRQMVARKMDAATYAVASMGVVLGMVSYRDSYSPYMGAVQVEAVSHNGRYVKVARLAVSTDGSTPDVWGTAKWVNASMYYRLADTLAEYKLMRRIKELEEAAESAEARAKQAAREDILKLSRNTVTRALVHAYDNDYCAETAVALISAGHKLPDVTLEVEVTYRGSITLDGNRSYYPLRQLFGTTRGDVSGASGLDIERYDVVTSAIQEAVSCGDMYSQGVRHLSTEVDWQAPVIRADASDLASNESYRIVEDHSNR